MRENLYYRTKIRNILVVVKKKDWEENSEATTKRVEVQCKDAINYR